MEKLKDARVYMYVCTLCAARSTLKGNGREHITQLFIKNSRCVVHSSLSLSGCLSISLVGHILCSVVGCCCCCMQRSSKDFFFNLLQFLHESGMHLLVNNTHQDPDPRNGKTPLDFSVSSRGYTAMEETIKVVPLPLKKKGK